MSWFGIAGKEHPLPAREQEAKSFEQASRGQPTKTKPTASRPVVGAAPITSRNRIVQHLNAASHAAALLDLLQETDYPPGYLLNYAELSKVYREMCAQNRWRLRGWISVGRAFDLLTTSGKKPYANFWTEDGRAQRLRVYPIPAQTASIPPATVSRAA